MISKQRLYWFLGLLILTVFTWLLWQPESIGLCPKEKTSVYYDCLEKYRNFSEPGSFLATALLISYVLVLLGRTILLKKWVKISAIYYILTLVMLFITPSVGDPLRLQLDRPQVALFLSTLYVIISLGLIAYKSWQAKKSA